MGTNFYTLKSHVTGESRHIGKRSAAGLYCWDCKVTLCKGRVHYGEEYHDTCPRCGQERTSENLDDSAAGRELGFNKSAPVLKTGVRTCASFSWAMNPSQIVTLTGVVDEYGQEYSFMEFMQVLNECPLQMTDSIGVEFS